ncbi:MAG: class I SAM-dependent RNA methyltransferase [Pseudomonadota bacterium]
MPIRLVVAPGLEQVLAAEVRDLGLGKPMVDAGGVEIEGDWQTVWRANLMLRGASRVLVRLGAFRALHLAQLDKRARKFPWAETLRPDVPVRVEATCKASRIYHAGAAQMRVERALREEMGITIADDAPIRVMARIDDDLCTFSVDTSGAPLHQRGLKQAVGKAPLRETLAALFLRQAGYTPPEPVLDPMCGSGTFLLEAADLAAGQLPGRARSFALEQLASFNAARWANMTTQESADAAPTGAFFGSDRDAGAIKMAGENAARAGLNSAIHLTHAPISALERPDGPPGLVMTNPPYGGRIGNKKLLYGLYAALGQVLRERFSGWRVGIVTSEPGLATATGLPINTAGPPVAHGGLKVRLYLSGTLPG